jgi:ribonuclease-3
LDLVPERCPELCRRLGYTFIDQCLLEAALTHRSAGPRNNERLEFLGDAILNFVIADEVYRRFPEAKEGDLSRLRASLVKRDALAKLAREIQLGGYLSLGPGELKSGGSQRDSILADALEAIFGGIYLDTTLEACRRTILALYQERLESLSLTKIMKDPKTRLQEYLQARGLPLPLYRVLGVEEGGEPRTRDFVVECSIEGFPKHSRGQASSRRRAEQEAANQMLHVFANE